MGQGIVETVSEVLQKTSFRILNDMEVGILLRHKILSNEKDQKGDTHMFIVVHLNCYP